MTLLNYWHYIFFAIAGLLFVLGVISAFRQTNKKLVFPMILSVTLVSVLLAVFSTLVVDKYTKKVELSKVKNKRLLSTEQIVYTGLVKNTGNFPIGKVVLEIKLVNKGLATGNVKAGNFYKPSGFFEFFGGGGGGSKEKKVQSITKKFVIARNMKAGTAKRFRVYFKFPPHFRSVAQFLDVSGR